MDLEKREKRDFSKMSVQKQLKVLDSNRRKELNKTEKRVNNLKWQRVGVLNLRNKPNNDLKENYSWQESVSEIQKTIEAKKIMGMVG